MIRIENLSKSFGVQTLFDSITYQFPVGEKIALVGANGAGKSTLLNLLIGLDRSDGGAILRPQNCILGYLPQEPNPAPAATILAEAQAGAEHLHAMAIKMQAALDALETCHDEEHMHAFEAAESAYKTAGGYRLESETTSVLQGLGFPEEKLLQHPSTLSGGWRMRLELAKIFIKQPDFLILDEPTNHLDLPSLVWVENYLANFRGTLLFVSHDRTLLNKLAKVTLHLDHGKLTPYKGNYDQFLIAAALRTEQDQSRREGLLKRQEELEKFATRFGAKASKAKQAQSKMKMAGRIEEQVAQIAGPSKQGQLRFSLPKPENSPRILYRITNGSIGYTQPLSRGLNLEIEKGQKIAIIGANGIGKSTLLRTIAAKLPALSGDFTPALQTQLAYFAQDQLETLDGKQSIMANILSNTTMGERQARQLLGSFLFQGNDVFKEVRVLSGGEKSRVGLACVLAQKQNFLLLDEPTNHLDMQSAETLIQALDAYEGTLLFVSHDRELIDEVCTHVFAMLADGRSMLFEGKLDDYARLAPLAGFPNVLEPVNPKTAPKPAPQAVSTTAPQVDAKELKRRRQQLEKALESAETLMQKELKALTTAEAEMAQLPSTDYQKIEKATSRHRTLKAQVDDAEARWLDLQGELERVLEGLRTQGRL